MSVLDKHGYPLLPGTEVRVVGQVGTVQGFLDLEPPQGVFSDQLTGEVRVLVDGEEEEYPTYASDADNVCWDLEAI